jgi:alpha-L-arabinofuranosidase
MSSKCNRRTCLKKIAWATTAAAVSSTVRGRPGTILAAEPGSRSASRATIDVLLSEPIRDAEGKPAVVSPLLHGHFVEHIGGVVYDGVWVGPESKVLNVNGIRKSLVDSLKKIGPPVIRWPGGCFADGYHWQDGIGPRESRPRRFGRWNEKTEPNAFGTHEFMQFCHLAGAEPYFAANVGSGTVQEFQEWVEYCNAPAGRTTFADQRVANGDRDPFKVRYWGVGNENWACGGTFTPEAYCDEYRKFTTWLPSYGVPLYLIACGPTANGGAGIEWTRRFMKKWRDLFTAPLHGLSGHYYCGTSGTATQFTTPQWYDLLDKANLMEKFILDNWAVMAEHDSKHQVKFIVDEWGCWHPPGSEVAPGYQFSQTSTLRDALVAGITLDTFQRHAEKVSMACVAQLVNCLQSLYLAAGDQFVETVNHHVFAMYRDHQNGTAIPLKIEAQPIRFALDKKERQLFRLAGSASIREKTLTITLVHTHAEQPVEAVIKLGTGAEAASATATVLTHKQLNAADAFATPRAVVPRELAMPDTGSAGQLVLQVPPASVIRLRITLA